MTYTVTLNPSIDYIVKLDSLFPGKINRCREEELHAGGKGINVSLMLNVFQVDTVVVALVAGETGRFIESYVRNTGCTTDFIYLNQGYSRINVKITSDESTAINGTGPEIDASVIRDLCAKLQRLREGDWLVLAGSVPKTVPHDVYSRIFESVKRSNCRVIVDTTGNYLLEALGHRPFLIKPNTEELGEIFGGEPRSTGEIVHCARELQRRGALNVLVSRGGEGSVLLTEDGTVAEGNSPGGPVANTVGCGDAMVAGFIAGYAQSADCLDACRTAIAAASVKATSESAVTMEQILRMRSEVRLRVV